MWWTADYCPFSNFTWKTSDRTGPRLPYIVVPPDREPQFSSVKLSRYLPSVRRSGRHLRLAAEFSLTAVKGSKPASNGKAAGLRFQATLNGRS
jgi:hypothetical protein